MSNSPPSWRSFIVSSCSWYKSLILYHDQETMPCGSYLLPYLPLHPLLLSHYNSVMPFLHFSLIRRASICLRTFARAIIHAWKESFLFVPSNPNNTLCTNPASLSQTNKQKNVLWLLKMVSALCYLLPLESFSLWHLECSDVVCLFSSIRWWMSYPLICAHIRARAGSPLFILESWVGISIVS